MRCSLIVILVGVSHYVTRCHHHHKQINRNIVIISLEGIPANIRPTSGQHSTQNSTAGALFAVPPLAYLLMSIPAGVLTECHEQWYLSACGVLGTATGLLVAAGLACVAMCLCQQDSRYDHPAL